MDYLYIFNYIIYQVSKKKSHNYEISHIIKIIYVET